MARRLTLSALLAAFVAVMAVIGMGGAQAHAAPDSYGAVISALHHHAAHDHQHFSHGHDHDHGGEDSCAACACHGAHYHPGAIARNGDAAISPCEARSLVSAPADDVVTSRSPAGPERPPRA